METVVLYGFPAAGIIIGIVAVAKQAGLATKWAPLLALALGILAGIAVGIDQGVSLLQGVITGLVAGLMACGAYDQGKYISTYFHKEELPVAPTE